VCCHLPKTCRAFVVSQVAWSSSGGNSFLGGSMAQPSDLSAHTADLVDAEVKDLVERAYRCDALLWLLVCGTACSCFACVWGLLGAWPSHGTADLCMMLASDSRCAVWDIA
jgi:hypothetical protein